jgi:hypothetical protein
MAEPATLVVIRVDAKGATMTVAPDRERQVTLTRDEMVAWKHIRATEHDWYMEAVMPAGNLFWSVFIPGFDAAWAFFSSQLPDVREAGGYIRVGGADGAIVDELMSFDDAAALGRNPLSARMLPAPVCADGLKLRRVIEPGPRCLVLLARFGGFSFPSQEAYLNPQKCNIPADHRSVYRRQCAQSFLFRHTSLQVKDAEFPKNDATPVWFPRDRRFLQGR